MMPGASTLGDALVVDLDDVFVLYRGSTRDVAALRGLSLQVREGEVIVIHGPSGAGKSTFVRLVTAAIAPSAGSAWLFGHELSLLDRTTRGRLRRDSIGIITQHSADDLAPELTCIENVRLQPWRSGSSRQHRTERVTDALRSVGVEHLAERRPGPLSHGELQRVAIAAAIVTRPRLIVADEPTGQLDARNADAVLDLLVAVARSSSATLIIATHDETATRLADRVLTIADGRFSEERRRGDPTPRSVVDERGWHRLPAAPRRQAHIGNRAIISLEARGLLVAPESGAQRNEPFESSPRTVARTGGALIRRLDRVSHSFDNTPVLDSISMEVRRGELHAIVGRSGSGKSTLLAILSGWLRPTSGTVEQPACVDDVAICPAVPTFPDGLTVREVLELTQRIERRPPSPDAQRALLEQLGIGDLHDRRTAELSGGERQRVAVARCLISSAGLLLLDEPTAQLDRRSADRVIALLTRRDSDAAIVCATHDTDLVRRLDVVHTLDSGPA